MFLGKTDLQVQRSTTGEVILYPSQSMLAPVQLGIRLFLFSKNSIVVATVALTPYLGLTADKLQENL